MLKNFQRCLKTGSSLFHSNFQFNLVVMFLYFVNQSTVIILNLNDSTLFYKCPCLMVEPTKNRLLNFRHLRRWDRKITMRFRRLRHITTSQLLMCSIAGIFGGFYIWQPIFARKQVFALPHLFPGFEPTNLRSVVNCSTNYGSADFLGTMLWNFFCP